MNGFAARLKELREKAGMTQPQLADKAGLSKGGIAHLEQGLREPGWTTVQALAVALGVDCRAFADKPTDGARARAPQGRPAKTKQESPAEKRGRRARKKGYRDLPGT